MAEIAARADAKIGSLYRFFPNKDAVAEALMGRYAEASAERSIRRGSPRARRHDATPQELADILVIDLLVKKRHPQTRAFAALLDLRTDWTEVLPGPPHPDIGRYQDGVDNVRARSR